MSHFLLRTDEDGTAGKSVSTTVRLNIAEKAASLPQDGDAGAVATNKDEWRTPLRPSMRLAGSS